MGGAACPPAPPSSAAPGNYHASYIEKKAMKISRNTVHAYSQNHHQRKNWLHLINSPGKNYGKKCVWCNELQQILTKHIDFIIILLSIFFGLRYPSDSMRSLIGYHISVSSRCLLPLPLISKFSCRFDSLAFLYLLLFNNFNV